VAYTNINYKTKKLLKAAFAAGKAIYTHQPGGIFESKLEGRIYLEGPHYPQPHVWYAQADITDGKIVKLDGKTKEQVAAQLDKAALKLAHKVAVT
jgi:hypothetical protein